MISNPTSPRGGVAARCAKILSVGAVVLVGSLAGALGCAASPSPPAGVDGGGVERDAGQIGPGCARFVSKLADAQAANVDLIG